METKLLAAAQAARDNAYAPYSKFKVGATGSSVSATTHKVLNLRTPLQTAAKTAFRSAQQVKPYEAFSILQPVAPCGACRQVLAEFPFEKIILANCKGQTKTMSVSELLPYGFGSESMNIKK